MAFVSMSPLYQCIVVFVWFSSQPRKPVMFVIVKEVANWTSVIISFLKRLFIVRLRVCSVVS